MCCAVSMESFSPAGLIAAAFLEPFSLLFTACACLCDDSLLLSQLDGIQKGPFKLGFQLWHKLVGVLPFVLKANV